MSACPHILPWPFLFVCTTQCEVGFQAVVRREFRAQKEFHESLAHVTSRVVAGASLMIVSVCWRCGRWLTRTSENFCPKAVIASLIVVDIVHCESVCWCLRLQVRWSGVRIVE
jgi:hypothetical protein